jgi:hypothetical protein
MSIVDDKNVKSKLLKQMQDSIQIKQDQRDYERQSRLNEEREYLRRINLEGEAEKRRQFMKKQQLATDNMSQFNSYHVNKQKQVENQLYDKLQKKNVSLEINHEERLGQMKDYFMKLNDKVDNNMQIYENYASKEPRMSPVRPHVERQAESYIPTEKPVSPKPEHFFPESKPTKSDITSNYVFDKLTNRDYGQYRDLQQSYLNYNRNTMDYHSKERDNNYSNKRYASVERLRDLDRYNHELIEAKKYKNDQQNLYRYILDSQIKNKVDPKHMVYSNDFVPINPCIYY